MPGVLLTLLLLVMPEVLHKLLLLAMQALTARLKSLLMQVEIHVQMQMGVATLSLTPASTVHAVACQGVPSW